MVLCKLLFVWTVLCRLDVQVLLVGARGETRNVVCLTIRIVSLLPLYKCSATFAGALGGCPWGSPETLLSYYLLVFVSGGPMVGRAPWEARNH